MEFETKRRTVLWKMQWIRMVIPHLSNSHNLLILQSGWVHHFEWMSEYQGNFSSHLQPKQFDINSVDVTTKAYNSLNDMTTSTMMQTAVWINQSIIMIMHHLRYPKKKNVIYVRIVQAVLDLIRIFSVLDSRNKSNFLLQWLSYFFFFVFSLI